MALCSIPDCHLANYLPGCPKFAPSEYALLLFVVGPHSQLRAAGTATVWSFAGSEVPTASPEWGHDMHASHVFIAAEFDRPALVGAPSLLFLAIAGLCLLLALHFLRRVVVPVGPLLQAAAAVAMVALSVGAALLFLIAAAWGAR